MKYKYLRTFAFILTVFLSQFISAQCYTVYYPSILSGCQGTKLVIFPNDTVTLDTSTTYYDTTGAATMGGCDSVLSQQVLVTPIVYNISYDTICASQFPYAWDGQTLRVPGTYGDTLFSLVSGCDSVILLYLASRPNSGNDTFHTSACATAGGAGGGYDFYGTIERRSGTYYHVGGPVPGASACTDSVIVLSLTLFGGAAGPPTPVAVCGSSYDFGGTTLTANGTYTDTLKNVNGCDSAIISITLTLNAPYDLPTAINGVSCGGAPFIWRGNSYPGPVGGPMPVTYYDTIAGLGGCDTIYTITVRNGFPPAAVNVRDSFCAGSTYTYETYTFTTAGRDTLTLPAATGCDTTVYLLLTYKAAPTYLWVDSFCEGSSYTYRGHTYIDSGLHFFTEPAPAGCDSIIEVSLSYKSAPTINLVDSFCQGTSYTYRGNTYTTAGVHAITIAAPSGCDSVINLDLSYTVPPAANIAATICQGTWYVYEGIDSFNTRGFHTFTVTHAGECDSTVNLNLTITPAPRLFVTDSFCQGTTYYYKGDSFTTAGAHTFLIPASVGCDTAVTLNLTYKVATPVPVISQSGNILIVNPAASSYQWYLNGSAITGATSQTYVPTQSGVYSVTTGGASACPGFSANDTVTNVGINEVKGSDQFKIYPNPNNGKFTVETAQFIGTEITIYDVVGRIVYQKQMTSSKESIDMGSGASGTYYLVMKNQQFTGYTHFVVAQ